MKPSFGIVVACYNSERFIPKLAESLKAQTYKAFDVVFVDDCSTDCTTEIIAECTAFTSWGRIKLKGRNDYVHGDHGICESFNVGAKSAMGGYLWFIHADTWLEPDCLQKLSDYIERTGCKFLTARELRYDSDQDIHAPVAPHGACALDLFGNPVLPLPCNGRPHSSDFPERTTILNLKGKDYVLKLPLPTVPKPYGVPEDVKQAHLEECLIHYAIDPTRSETKIPLLYGGNLNCFERELFNRIGGFDEWIQICCDEQDNGWRVALAGERAGYAYEARIHHWLKDQKPLSQFETHRVYKCTVNQMYYILKNARSFLLLMFPAYALLMLGQSMVLAVLCRKPELPYWLFVRPLCILAKSWGHILKARAEVRRYRVHSDWWFFRRFIYKGFGQWFLVKKLCRKVINEIPTIKTLARG